MNRRKFIKNSTLTGVFFAIYPSSYSFSAVLNSQNKRLLTHQPLPIPALIDTTEGETIYLNINNGESNFYEDTITRTSGVNTDYLGPALKMRKGKTAKIQVNNNLDETITLHWHGLEITGNKDGGPHQMIKAGDQWKVDLPIAQPAATCWFHPHQYPQTAELVMRGIAGLIVIEDEESDKLNLPSDWGVNDVPIIIQDRKFDPQGQFDYKLLDIVNVSTGFAGDTLLVNGAIHPILDVSQGWTRLRILNGSNARSYLLSFSNQQEFYIVASDCGFLTAPVVMSSLHISAGERFEILIKVHEYSPFDLVTHPLHQMGMISPPFNEVVTVMTLKPNKSNSKGILPNNLAKISRYKLDDVKQKRNVVLEMGEGLDSQAMMIMRQRKSGLTTRLEMIKESNQLMPMMKSKNIPRLTIEDLKVINSINGKPFDINVIDLKVNKGELEHWVISQGKDMMIHPFHIHGCRFQVLSVNGEQPEPHLMGWKDTVTIFPKGVTEILVKFEYTASEEYPYMAHCHILEHEDTGMMMQFTVN